MDKKSNRLKYIGISLVILILLILLALLGAVLVLIYLSRQTIGQFILRAAWLKTLLHYTSIISIVSGWILPFVGIILGIIALKKGKKRSGIIGIALSIFGITSYIITSAIAFKTGLL